MNEIPKLTITCVKDLLTVDDWHLVRKESLKNLWLVSIRVPLSCLNIQEQYESTKYYNQKVFEAKDIKELKEKVSKDETFLLYIASWVLYNTEEDIYDEAMIRITLLRDKYVNGSLNTEQTFEFETQKQKWIQRLDFILLSQLLTNTNTI